MSIIILILIIFTLFIFYLILTLTFNNLSQILIRISLHKLKDCWITFARLSNLLLVIKLIFFI